MQSVPEICKWICFTISFIFYLVQPVYADDHGDSVYTATQIGVGSITQGSIDTPGDLDYFKFTINQPGKYVLYTRGSSEIQGHLYDSSYSQLDSDYGDGESDNFRIVYNFIYTGTYYVSVKHQNSYSGIGDYTFHVEGSEYGTVSDDHGFSPWSASAVQIGSITAGTINLPGDMDYFKFTINQPGKYVLYTRGSSEIQGYLYDSSYFQLDSDYGDGENDNFRIVYNFIYTGTYYVSVSHQNSYSGIGDFTFHLEGSGHGTVSDDHGFSPWSASAVQIGSITAGAIDLPGDMDYFKFTINKPGKYVLYTRGRSEIQGYLYDSSYSQLDSDYGDGESDNFRIVYNYIYTGTYYVSVRHQNSYSGIGDYAFHVDGSGYGTVSDDHGFSPWSAFPISNAGLYSGRINLPGDLDFYKINVPQTSMIYCYTTVNSISVDTTGKLYDANYDLITSNSNSGEYNNFRIERQLLPGVYYIEISHSDSYSGLGEYTLHIEGLTTVKGDVSGDGFVTLTDVILTLQVLAGQQSATLNLAADVDGDDKIGTVEAIYTIQKVAGL